MLMAGAICWLETWRLSSVRHCWLQTVPPAEMLHTSGWHLDYMVLTQEWELVGAQLAGVNKANGRSG